MVDGQQVQPQVAQEAPPQEAPQGGATDLVVGINSGMMSLMEIMEQSPAVSPEDKQKLGVLIQGFQSFVSDLGQAPGQAPPQGVAPTGVAPANAGGAEVQQAL